MASRSPYDAKTYPYDRPQMPWRCGDPLQDCRQGPDGRGRCQGGAVCIPLKNDDSWRCGRPRAAGGNCEQGPDGEGNCGLELSRCTPTPSRWLQRRRAFKWGTFLFVCALLFSTTGDRFSSFFNPGDLHAHHVRNSCVDCHNAELEEPFAFIHLGLGFDRGDHGMTDRCLVCHQLGDQGSNPHSVSFARLRMSRKRILDDLPGLSSLLPPDPPAEMMISCARCHPQHHGEMEPTTILSDSGCQSCHGRKFSSFSEGHPEFGSELGRLPRSIKFNHADHFSRHFEENTENAKKNCNGCHELDSDTQTFGYRSYEQSCKNCHEQEIASWEGTTGEPGFEVIGIPQIDFETLRGADLSIGDWPQAAPLAEFLDRLEQDEMH
ncbi:MAG TPA: hypothetical protein EYN79_00290 [Planctomycetes bacterium]|nr:hypothetical protein [Planctomycetota bacterium]